MNKLNWFNSEGDYLNIKWNESTERYEGDLILPENSSDTHKTIGLYLFENVPAFDYESKDYLKLQKYQLFNEYNINISGNQYKSENVWKIEPCNLNGEFFSKWIWGPEFEKKFPIGSKISFDSPVLEFLNDNQIFTVVSVKSGAILIISNKDNLSFYNQWGIWDHLSSTYSITISGVNNIGIYDYIDDDLNNKLSNWSEPNFYAELYNDRKLNLINFEKNESVVTVKNCDVLNDNYWIYSTTANGLTQSSNLICELILKTDLPLIYSNGIQIDVNKITFTNKIPDLLKPDMQFTIFNSTNNTNNITIDYIPTFIGNVNLTQYQLDDQVIWNNKIYQCVQTYTQSAFSGITPDDINYWTNNINYLPVIENLTPEIINSTQIYLTTNKFYYEFEAIYGTFSNYKQITLASFAEKYKSEFDFFNIDLQWNNKLESLEANLIYPTKYAEVNFYLNSVLPANNIGTAIKKYQHNTIIDEELIFESNTNISENWKYNIVFTDLDEWGLKITINGMPYYEEIYWIYDSVLNVDMIKTIDKTVRNWFIRHYYRLYTLGILPILSYQGGSYSNYYNSISLVTEYPNVSIEFNVEVGTTADFYIQHTDLIFYDLDNPYPSITININNKSYPIDYTNTISNTLLNWVDKYSDILDDYGIFVRNLNNMILFSVKSQDTILNFDKIYVGRSPLPGEIIWKKISKILGNLGCLITSNSMILADENSDPPNISGFTTSFIDAGFSTGMVVNVNNTIYPYNNQQYNILYLDNYNVNYSYQGPFWGTETSSCVTTPYTYVAFSLGFGATGCGKILPPLGEFDYDVDTDEGPFAPDFSTVVQPSNYYTIDIYNGNYNMVDIIYINLIEKIYVLSDDIVSYNAIDGKIDKIIPLGLSTSSISLKWNPVNNYLYCVTKGGIYLIDVTTDTIKGIIHPNNTIFDCCINYNTGDVYISYEDSNDIDVYTLFNNTLTLNLGLYNYYFKMEFHILDGDLYLSNGIDDTLFVVDVDTMVVKSTHNISNLKNTLLYESGAIWFFGDTLYKIEGGLITQISGVTSGANNFIIFDNINNNLIISNSNNSLYSVDLLGNIKYNKSIGDFGFINLSQFDEDVYLCNQLDKVKVISPDSGNMEYSVKFYDKIIKIIYNPVRKSIWGIPESMNELIEINVAISDSPIDNVYTQLIDYEDNNWGSLDPDYTNYEGLWIKSESFLRKPRDKYESEGLNKTQWVYKWLDDQVPEMFLYDFSGELLETDTIYSYTGEKPLNLVSLNKYPNRNLDLVELSEFQQTVFDEIPCTLDYIDSSTNISYLPSAIQCFIGFNSTIEGMTSSVLMLIEREDISLKILTDNINLNKITFYSIEDPQSVGYEGVIELNNNSENNFLYDINGNKTGLNVGQIIQIFITDKTNENNKYISTNNGKIFKISKIYTRSILLDYISDELDSEYTFVENYPNWGNFTQIEVEIKVIEKELARFNISGQTENEDERYRIELSNTGHLISSDNVYIFKEYDINEQGIDWKYLNQKRKEMLLVRSDIFPYVGSYKAIINAINYFGYNDLQLNEYYRNIDETSDKYLKLIKAEIPDIFDNSVEGWTETNWVKGLIPNKNYIDTNLFNLTYKITDKSGNKLLTYSLWEVIVKLQGLKYWLQENVIPISHRILDIVGETYFDSTTYLKNSLTNAIILNQNQNLCPVNFTIPEAYISPILSGSSVYTVNMKFTISNISKMPDYYGIFIRTYKTHTEWQPFITYNLGDRVIYYDQLWESLKDNNRLNNPKKWDSVSEWSSSVTYTVGDIVSYKNIIYGLSGITTSNPALDPLWINISYWKKVNFTPVQTLKEFRTDLSDFNFTIDSNIDPFIVVEVTSDNGYGQIYKVNKNYELRSTKDLTYVVQVINPDPIPVKI